MRRNGSGMRSSTACAGGGAPGINTATIFLYQRTATDSPPSLPASTLTYNFGTLALSGPLGSWSRAMPTSGGAFRWMRRISWHSCKGWGRPRWAMVC